MNKNNELLMVLDAGGGGCRCLIFTPAGAPVASAYLPWSFHAPADVPFGSEFNPDEFWRLLGEVTTRALQEGTVSPRAIQGIGTTSFRDGVVFLDENGVELYGGSNMDARGITCAGDIAARIGGERVKEITGRHPLGLDAAARLLWFRENRPAEYERIRHILMVSDWIVYRLTGTYTSEPSNACSSMLFDIRKGEWSAEIAAALELPSIFPPCRQGGERAGLLSPAAAEHLGLPAGIPVAVGMGDSQAGVLGCGCTEHGRTAAILGTTMPVQMVVAEPVDDPAGRTWLGNHVLPGRWVLESNGGAAGMALQWYRDHFASPGSADPFGDLERVAAAEEPGAAFAFLGPRVADMSSLQFPLYGAIFFPTLGMTPSLTGPRLARAVLENVAYAARGNLEQLEELAGVKVERLYACGGMTRSPLMVRILAAVCGVPVAVPAVREASSLGAAMGAAVAGGLYRSLPEAAAAMARLEEPVLDESLARQYRGLYREWQDLNQKLSG